ncbi:MAG: GyrI-like domain-containing protein [Clostridia bacterium]|nr:GyrI-like domain-containing protein [Clostridia bacterium]
METKTSGPRKKPTEPEITTMASQKMAVVYTKGDPNAEMTKAMPALFGSVYKLKFELKKQGVEFKVGKLRARWPDAHLVPKDQWTGIWALPVPNDVTELPQKVQDVEVKLETWHYGIVAQVLHIGPYSEEGPTVQRLHDFINENGYQLAGQHEEEYLTTPTAKVQKTIIRYEISPR